MIDRSPRHVNINWIVERLKIEHGIERMKHTICVTHRVTRTTKWEIAIPVWMNQFERFLCLYHCSSSSCYGEFPLKNESTVQWIFILYTISMIHRVGHLVDDHAHGKYKCGKSTTESFSIAIQVYWLWTLKRNSIKQLQ